MLVIEYFHNMAFGLIQSRMLVLNPFFLVLSYSEKISDQKPSGFDDPFAMVMACYIPVSIAHGLLAFRAITCSSHG